MVLGSVGDLKAHITKLDKTNDALAKEVKQQVSVMFELRSQVQLLTQELRTKQTTQTPAPKKQQQQQQQGQQQQQQSTDKAPTSKKGKSQTFADIAAAGPPPRQTSIRHRNQQEKGSAPFLSTRIHATQTPTHRRNRRPPAQIYFK